MLPTLLGHRSGKVFGRVVKLRFGVYEEFNDPVWVPFRGTLLGALP